MRHLNIHSEQEDEKRAYTVGFLFLSCKKVVIMFLFSVRTLKDVHILNVMYAYFNNTAATYVVVSIFLCNVL